jgi:hypothetical protein
MVLDTLSADGLFTEQGWVAGSFPNLETHMRSLVNGQDSTVCPVGKYLAKFPKFVWGQITTPGGLHCWLDVAELPVYCWRDKD